MKKMIREQLKKDNKGFSLAELIVVVLILGILAVAITPQIMNWINKSKEGKDQSYAGTLAVAAESLCLEWLGKGEVVANKTLTFKVDATGVTETGSVATAAQAQALEDMIGGTTKCIAPQGRWKDWKKADGSGTEPYDTAKPTSFDVTVTVDSTGTGVKVEVDPGVDIESYYAPTT